MIPPNQRKNGMSKRDVMVLVNAEGGPRIMGKNDTVDLASQKCIGGQNPKFESMGRGDAERLIATYRAAEMKAAKSSTAETDAHDLEVLAAEIKADLEALGVPRSIPTSSLEEAQHDKFMLAEIVPRFEAGKPITPAQYRWLVGSIKRFEDSGTPIPEDIVRSLLKVPIQGEPKPSKWPTFADEVIHAKPHTETILPAKLQKTMAQRVAHAEKIVLTSEAVERIAAAFIAYPEQVILNGDFAIPPFERCWIELPNRTWGENIGYRLEESADTRIGFLFWDGRVYVCARGETNREAWSPISYQLNSYPKQAMVARELHMVGCGAEDIDRFYWGEKLRNMVGHDKAMALRARHGVQAICSFPPCPEPIWKALAADMPLILSILLTLNTPSRQVLQYRDVERRSRASHKGRVQLHAHRIVTIDLDRAPSVRLLSRETDKDRETRHVGWHEVRGHFVHDKTYRETDCTHSGPDGDYWCEYEPKRWECLKCGSKRSWRTYPNGRGDRNKPVEHHYVVKGRAP